MPGDRVATSVLSGVAADIGAGIAVDKAIEKGAT